MAFCDGIVPNQKFEMEPSYDARVQSVKDVLSNESLEQMAYQEVLDLRTGFIYLSIVDSENEAKYKEYFYLLEKITEYFNASVPKIASWTAPVWHDVIRFIKQLPEFPRTNAFFLEEFRCQERERARAAVRLRDYGVVVKVKENDLAIENIDGLIGLINDLSKSIGGKNGIKLMLGELQYRRDVGRYLVPHQGNLPSPTMVGLEVPYGYLFNLFLKWISAEPTSSNIKQDYEKLKSIATDFCLAKYNSQKFDLWHDVLRPDRDIVGLVHELVVRFDIYYLPQSGVAFTAEWCRFLVKHIKRDARCGSLLKECLGCFERILNWWNGQSSDSECVVIQNQKGRILSDIPNVFRDYYIKDAASINQSFNYPVDILGVNYMMHPIYKNNDSYILLPKTLGIWSWYEALYAIVKRYGGDLAKEIGLFIEDFIRTKMATHRITSHTGKYEYNGIEGEVDILSQARDGDVIIECKKKSLSRHALKGDDFFIWSELYDILYSQMQCARTENGVRNFGPLLITDTRNNETFSYSWIPTTSNEAGDKRERIVAKVTLTLKEYGPMQDMLLISRMMKSLSSKQINANYPQDTYKPGEIKDFTKYFGKINDTLDKIRDYYSAIGTKDPTFHCRFLSLEQLYFLIRISNSNDDLLKYLAQNYVSTGTENFWNEFVNTSSLIERNKE